MRRREIQNLLEKFISFLKDKKYYGFVIEYRMGALVFDLFAYSEKGVPNIFEIVLDLKKGNIRKLITASSLLNLGWLPNNKKKLNLVIFQTIDIDKSEVTFADISLLNSNNITIYELEEEKFKEFLPISKSTQDKQKESIQLILGDEEGSVLLNKLETKELSNEILAGFIQLAYKEGFEDNQSYSEEKEFVSMFIGDLAIGGFFAGGIFLIIDAFRTFFDWIALGAGVGFIIIGIGTFYFLRDKMRKIQSKNQKYNKIINRMTKK